MKVGQILGLSKNGAWDLVDVRRFFFPNILLFDLFFPEKVKKNVSGAFDTPNIKVGQMCDIWKNRSWSAVDARTSFFFIFSQFDLFFQEKVIKIGFFCTFLHCEGTLGLWKGFIHSLLTFKIFSMRPYLTYLQRKKKSFLKPTRKTSQFCPSLEALTMDMPLNHSKLSRMKKIDILVGKYTIKKSLQKPAHRDLTLGPSLEGG